MTEVPVNARYEVKFISYSTFFNDFIMWIKTHQAAFTEKYPARWINNIYFDSHNLRAFNDNLAGISIRSKVRYRWYGDISPIEKGTLEIKRKRNCFGWKHHFKIDSRITGKNWIEIRKIMLSFLDKREQEWLKCSPCPVLINRYFRHYYESQESGIRLTVDTMQCVFDQRCKPYPNLKTAVNIPQLMIVEFKFDRTCYNEASDFIQQIPLRNCRYSKYASGVTAMVQEYSC